MNNLLLASAGEKALIGFGIVFLVLFIILGALAGISAIVAGICRIILVVKYRKNNRKELENGVTAEQAARAFLDANGLTDVKVEKAGWFKGIFAGNFIDTKNNIIYLRGNIYGKKTITAVGMALQKVTQAIQLKKGERGIKANSGFRKFALFAPVLIIPLMLIGLALDFIIFQNIGYATIISSVVSIAFYVMALVFSIIQLKVEVRANNQTIEMLRNSNLMTAEEINDLEGVYKAYKIAYIAEFLTALFRTLYEIMKLILQILHLFGRK